MWLNYNAVWEWELAKRCVIKESVALWTMMSHEGFKSHVEDVEPEHQDLPPLRKSQ